MRSAECGMAGVFRGIGEGRARRRAAGRARALGCGRAVADVGGGVPGCSVRAGAERARARSREGMDARGRGARAGARPARGGRSHDVRRRRPLTGRRRRGRGLRARRARARRLRAARPGHARRRGPLRVPAGAWEADVLPARLGEYDPLWLDGLCLSGEIAWGRLSPAAPSNGGHKSGPIRTTPIALFRRERGAVWQSMTVQPDPAHLPLSHSARAVLEALGERGASFFGDLVNATGLLRTEAEKGLGELVAWGLVTSDSFAGLRALLVPSDRRRPIGGFRRRGHVAPFGVETAGRWSRVRRPAPLPEEAVAEAVAWQLLRRYGVVFRRLVTRETLLTPWRDILRVYRRLEARGEIRGGRFVGGFSGEQYALPEAVGLLRSVRREEPRGELVAVSGADPLNLVGIVTPGDVVAGVATNRILYRDGIPVAIREGAGSGERYLVEVTPEERERIKSALVRGRVAPLVRTYLGKTRPASTAASDPR